MTRPTFPGGGRAAVIGYLLALATASGIGCRQDVQGQTTQEEPPRHTNALIHSDSPYLLQHAHNPVNWMPWGPEAFEIARREDKPIFVSIGYSTCYWCHVMERESFEDEEVARVMNEHYVCIKVDREQRPDIDQQLMLATQLMTGRGGWPNSVWLTPDGRPFVAGTYFPRDQFLAALKELARIWREERPQVEKQADALSDAIRRAAAPVDANERGNDGDDPLQRILAEYRALFDAEHGGFGNRPKFPPHGALLILAQASRQGDDEARHMLRATLEAMWCGGIHDHVGGGFHRYSTDERWLLPHFEKMLYDNAQLMRAYAEAYAITRAPLYRSAIADIFRWLQRDMRSPEGGFYSALDSISPGGGEGEYYTWTIAEVEDVLGPEEGEHFATTYHFEPAGNYLEESTGHRTGRNIPYLHRNQIDLALDQRLARARTKLLEHRRKRPRPARDDKVLAGWNGLMIAGLARAGQTLDDPTYVESAGQAAEFLLSQMRDGDARLLRSWRTGKAGILAYLDDYAYTIDGLLELHAASGESRWRTAAVELTDQAIELFGDTGEGGFFFSSTLHETLLLRAKGLSGGGNLPDPNGVMVRVLHRLATDPQIDAQQRAKYAQFAARTIQALRSTWTRNPRQVEHLVLAMATRPAEGPPAGGNLPANRYRDAVVAAQVEPVAIQTNASGAVVAVELGLHLEIADGFHLYGAEDSEAPAIVQPLTVTLKPAQEWKMVKIEFPSGERQMDAILQREMVRYHNGIDIRLWIEPEENAAVSPPPISVEVKYQACDATRCLAPVRFMLTVSLSKQPPGPVQPTAAGAK